jgi:biopolymer transport protein ExbD
VKVDLPQQSNEPAPLVEPEKNKVYIDPQGNLFWNSVPIDEVTLQQYLERTTSMNPEPELHFQPDPQARYEKVDQVLAIVKRANVTKLGFVGNEQYRNDF